uniref:Uncharacterized protein n=1 Tax=Compsopogon caeruleus TaxID=31354 RepID=A0A7S1TEP4_9RHOD|mmetsp:Transcript_3660/g.6975  ORF Transcript_3660/g.6975 Transcript_3660/m.6975 type:complete len:678 (+) Transcript_3660:82-2115(+)
MGSSGEETEEESMVVEGGVSNVAMGRAGRVGRDRTSVAALVRRTRGVMWTPNEERRFLEALERFGRDWKACAAFIGTRTDEGVRSHAQKYFIKLFRAGMPLPQKVQETGTGYTLSGNPLNPKSKAALDYLARKPRSLPASKVGPWLTTQEENNFEPPLAPGKQADAERTVQNKTDVNARRRPRIMPLPMDLGPAHTQAEDDEEEPTQNIPKGVNEVSGEQNAPPVQQRTPDFDAPSRKRKTEHRSLRGMNEENLKAFLASSGGGFIRHRIGSSLSGSPDQDLFLEALGLYGLDWNQIVRYMNKSKKATTEASATRAAVISQSPSKDDVSSQANRGIGFKFASRGSSETSNSSFCCGSSGRDVGSEFTDIRAPDVGTNAQSGIPVALGAKKSKQMEGYSDAAMDALRDTARLFSSQRAYLASLKMGATSTHDCSAEASHPNGSSSDAQPWNRNKRLRAEVSELVLPSFSQVRSNHRSLDMSATAAYDARKSQVQYLLGDDDVGPPEQAEHSSLDQRTAEHAPLSPRFRRSTKILRDPRPSLHCHICARTSGKDKRRALYVCQNIKRGVCQKVICEKCMADYQLTVHLASDPESGWICPHCEGRCPRTARCVNYHRTNKNRSEGRKAPPRPRDGQTPSTDDTSSTAAGNSFVRHSQSEEAMQAADILRGFHLAGSALPV